MMDHARRHVALLATTTAMTVTAASLDLRPIYHFTRETGHMNGGFAPKRANWRDDGAARSVLESWM